MLKRFLVAVDGSDLSTRILLPVRRFLAAQGGGNVTLLQIIGAKTKIPAGDWERAMHSAEDGLNRLRGRLTDLDETKSSIRVEQGNPAETILACVEEHSPDLVAMATHGRSGISRWIRGSVAERVMRNCPAPLLLCNPHSWEEEGGRGTFRRILVPLDGSDLAGTILPLVAEVARIFDSEVILLRVEDEDLSEESPEGKERARQLEAYLGSFRENLERDGLERVAVMTAFGNPAATILDTVGSQEIDLVAMSTHGRAGYSRWRFGSVAETVTRHCPTQLLIKRVGSG